MILEDSYISFLVDNDLTQGQYLLLHLVYKGRQDLIKKYKDKFPSYDNTMIGETFIKDLFNREFLEETKEGKVIIGKKFKAVFINKHTATEEIYAVYPTHFEKDGISIPLSAMDRNVFANIYDNAIQSSVAEHLEVIEDIKFGISESLLNIGLDKFLKSKYWLILRSKRLNHIIKSRTKTALDYDF